MANENEEFEVEDNTPETVEGGEEPSVAERAKESARETKDTIRENAGNTKDVVSNPDARNGFLRNKASEIKQNVKDEALGTVSKTAQSAKEKSHQGKKAVAQGTKVATKTITVAGKVISVSSPFLVPIFVVSFVALLLSSVYITYGKNDNVDNCFSGVATSNVASDVPRSDDGRVDIPNAQRQIASFLMSYEFESLGGPMTKEQAAGVLGNLYRESGYDNRISEKDGKGYTNQQVVDMGGGYHRAVGLIQWDGVRRTNLAKFAMEKGKNWDDFDLQLEFLAHEIDTGGYGKTLVSKGWTDSISASEAAILWEHHYEISADTIGSHGMNQRISVAEEAMDVIGSPTTSFSSGGCGGSFDNGGIVEMALSVSLTSDEKDKSYAINNPSQCSGESNVNGGTGFGRNTAKANKPEYYQAVVEAMEGQNNHHLPTYFAGCDRFVGAVMYHTVDPEYPLAGPALQREHMESSNNYKFIGTNISQAEPGDVMVTSSATDSFNTGRHIAIYMGQENGKHMIAHASNGSCKSGSGGARIGVYEAWYGTDTPVTDNVGIIRHYNIYRYVG